MYTEWPVRHTFGLYFESTITIRALRMHRYFPSMRIKVLTVRTDMEF